jgi:hypothetical protein
VPLLALDELLPRADIHAGFSDVSNLAMSRMAVASVLGVLGGGDTRRVVNPGALDRR